MLGVGSSGGDRHERWRTVIQFSVVDWAAWAPGLGTRAAWLDWARAPWSPQGEASPELSEVPPMQRRRIDRVGRMAVQAAWWCSRADARDVPLIFVSRHGDVQRSCELLGQLARGEGMSPTHFGLSVHNAVAALYSIIRGERGNYLALAAGGASAEAAVVEAVGLLSQGAPEVLLVLYEAAMPAMHHAFMDEPDSSFAWSWRLRRAGEGAAMTLAWAADEAPTAAASTSLLPAGLEALRFLLSGTAMREHRVDGLRWSWRRHDHAAA